MAYNSECVRGVHSNTLSRKGAKGKRYAKRCSARLARRVPITEKPAKGYNGWWD